MLLTMVNLVFWLLQSRVSPEFAGLSAKNQPSDSAFKNIHIYSVLQQNAVWIV